MGLMGTGQADAWQINRYKRMLAPVWGLVGTGNYIRVSATQIGCAVIITFVSWQIKYISSPTKLLI